MQRYRSHICPSFCNLFYFRKKLPLQTSGSRHPTETQQRPYFTHLRTSKSPFDCLSREFSILFCFLNALYTSVYVCKYGYISALASGHQHPILTSISSRIYRQMYLFPTDRRIPRKNKMYTRIESMERKILLITCFFQKEITLYKCDRLKIAKLLLHFVEFPLARSKKLIKIENEKGTR